jgi:hypothetical protein
VGFGDIFLDPEVLELNDVFQFASLFLFGFTFLASFLGRLIEFITLVCHGKDKKSFVERLLENLATTHVYPDPNEILAETARIVPATTTKTVDTIEHHTMDIIDETCRHGAE